VVTFMADGSCSVGLFQDALTLARDAVKWGPSTPSIPADFAILGHAIPIIEPIAEIDRMVIPRRPHFGT